MRQIHVGKKRKPSRQQDQREPVPGSTFGKRTEAMSHCIRPCLRHMRWNRNQEINPETKTGRHLASCGSSWEALRASAGGGAATGCSLGKPPGIAEQTRPHALHTLEVDSCNKSIFGKKILFQVIRTMSPINIY